MGFVGGARQGSTSLAAGDEFTLPLRSHAGTRPLRQLPAATQRGPGGSRRRRDREQHHYAFVEVHDPGGAPSGSQRAVTTEPFLSPHFPRHAIRYTTAELLGRNLGGELRLESSWADGTDVVLLLPFCGDERFDLP